MPTGLHYKAWTICLFYIIYRDTQDVETNFYLKEEKK